MPIFVSKASFKDKYMKYILIIIALPFISNCTVIGFLGDVALDNKSESEDVEENRSEDSDFDESFTKVGAAIDAAIVLKVLSLKKDTSNEDKDDRACPEEGTRPTCTSKKGCWCEKIEHDN